MALEDVFWRLEEMGFTDVFLPFILVYTILFAILQKVNLFGAGAKKFNSIIALATSLGVVIPHVLGQYPPGTDVVQIMNTALPNVSLLIVVILFVMVVATFFGVDWGNKNWTSTVVTMASLVALLAIFASAAGWWTPYGPLSFLQDPDLQATLVIIAVFWILISVVTKDDTAAADKYDIIRFKGSGGSGGGAPPASGGGTH